MRITNSDLESAVAKNIISAEQARALMAHVESMNPEQARFQSLHVLYYFGGILILASMSWFLNRAWDNGLDLILISSVFAILYIMAGRNLWSQQNLKIPGGLLITAAVGLTPILIYGIERVTGIWPQETPRSYQDYHLWVKGSWFFMEIGTVLAALLALRFFKFAFLVFPLAMTLWYMSMDLTPLIFGRMDYNWDERYLVSCLFGVFVIGWAYWADRKYAKIDFSFWLYFFGVLAFWGGLSSMHSDNEFNKLIYCAINLGLIFVSVFLRRKVFLVFGALGIFGYIGHLAWDIFKDSYAFPIVLALLGIFILFLGVLYQRNKARFEAAVERQLPTFLLKWRPHIRN